jgi:hypothetical protein
MARNVVVCIPKLIKFKTSVTTFIMKKLTLYVLCMLLAGITLNSCKKDVSSIKTATATVSTITTGYYTYITVDKSDNIYGLQIADPTDTIYKITQTGEKSVFFITPTTTNADTIEHHPMQCLTTDSTGNVYTVIFNTAQGTADVLKISPTGVATVAYSSINMTLFQANAKIAFDGLGNFYYANSNTLYKISPAGSSSTILSSGFSSFTPDVYGNIYYANMGNSLQKISISGTTGSVASGKILGNVYDLGADIYGDVFISSVAGNDNPAIQILKKNDSVKTVISCPSGHLNGPVTTARISVALSQVTDAMGNLYFTQSDGFPFYIQKITF